MVSRDWEIGMQTTKSRGRIEIDHSMASQDPLLVGHECPTYNLQSTWLTPSVRCRTQASLFSAIPLADNP